MNLIEQLNQSFHMMTHLAAAQRLLQCFGNCGGLPLNLGTNPGRDIASNHPNVVEAEVFAAVRPSNNGKLHKEITKLEEESNAKHRFVFFYSPEYCAGRKADLELPDSTVQVWALGRDETMCN